jgi:flavodoxin
MKSLLILFSYHHKNTEKVANVFARVLDAQIQKPQRVAPEELQEYDLVGFGSGLYDEQHHRTLLDLADKLPQVPNRKALVFSTSGVTEESEVAKAHAPLREKLQAKGYVIVGEFNCAGFNTNSFLRLLGGHQQG